MVQEELICQAVFLVKMATTGKLANHGWQVGNNAGWKS